MSIERGVTRRTDAWKAELAAALEEHGRRTELARFLCDGDGGSLNARQTQISAVLNRGRMPEPEFVLATLEWLANLPLRKGRTPKKAARTPEPAKKTKMVRGTNSRR